MFLLDVNFWLALAFQAHQHHGSANTWMESAPLHSCCMCRVTQMAFLRLATNPNVLPNDALPLPDAWSAYDEMLSDERVVFAEEPAHLDTIWRNFTRQKTFSPNVWTDAYLAAFAEAANLEMVTFDKGFSQYGDLRYTILS